MNNTLLLQQFDLLATAPGGVAKLRELILTLAVQGKLVPQDPADEPASELLKRIRAEKDRLIAAGKIKRDKPLAAIGEDEQPFGLPVGWVYCRLGTLVLSIRSGGTPSKQNPAFWGGDIPWASVKDLRFGEPVSDTQDRITQAGLCAGSELAPAGSILICTRMGLGKIGEALIDVAINQDLKAVSLGAGIDKQYFINYFKTLAVVGSGMTVAGIKQEELLGFVVPLPPETEQTRIVARVEELMRVCDALEAKGQQQAAHHTQLVSALLGSLTASAAPEEQADDLPTRWQRVAQHFDTLLDRPEAIDALEQTILQLAVRGQLVPQDPNDEPASELLERVKRRYVGNQGKKRSPNEDESPGPPYDLPKSWTWARLGDLTENMGSGWSPACDEGERADPGQWAVLRTTAVQIDEFRAYEHKLLPSKLTPRPEIEVKDGDILITRAGPMNRVGISCWVDKPPPRLMLSDKIVRFHPTADEFLPSFFVLALNAGWTKDQLESAKSGMAASQVNISQNEMKGLWIPVCANAEQTRIVARVAHLRRLCADLRQRLTQSQTTQAALAEALAANAISGVC
ncbi:MAG: hypothetical protein RLZ68_1411 [Pseudomonadota bacterium]